MMAIEENKPAPSGRKVAFCVAQWGASTNVLAWAWLRQYFLRRGLDQIFIVHTGKDDRWKLGGPLCSDVETALRHWPHQIVSLQGSLQSNISSFIERHDIDLVVLGEDFPRQGGFQIVSVSEWVKSNITKPFIIIRQSAVRNERLRLSDQPEVGSPGRSYSLSLTPDSAPGRKVAIAYNSFTVGSRLMELAKRLILLPQDEIFIVHCFPFSKKVVKQTKNILRTIAMGLPVPGLTDEDVSEDNSVEFGAKELAGYSIHLNVVLRGDPRTALTSFCETEGIELLVISSRSAGRLRKTFSGGSVSGYLIDKAPCPCLVAPLKALGISAGDEEEVALSPRGSSDGLESPLQGRPLSPKEIAAEVAPEMPDDVTTLAAKVALLQTQMEEKDRIIRDLRDELASLRLEQAQAKDALQHDPAAAPSTY